MTLAKPINPLPKLELPNWLSVPVAEESQLIYEEILQQEHNPRPFTASEQINVLSRLACDQRMKKVWNELHRKERECPTKFLHPFKPDVLAGEVPQDRALRSYFRAAWDLATCGVELKTLQQLKPFIKMASRLQHDAQTLRSLGLDEFASDLEAKAVVCERMGGLPPNPTFLPLVVKRARGDQTVRAFVLRLSSICRDCWFGKGLAGTVATTASVALSKNISAEEVRNIVRSESLGLSAP